MRDVATTLTEVAGGVCLSWAAFTVDFGLGLAVTGVLLIGLGYLLGRG